MNTGTPASNPGARRHFQRPGPRAPKGRGLREAGEQRETSRTTHSDRTGREQTSSLAGHGRHAGHSDRARDVARSGASPGADGDRPGQEYRPDRTTAQTYPLPAAFRSRRRPSRTGSNSEGYNLTSIAIRFDNIASTSSAKSELTATLNEVSSGNPGSALCTLVTPDLTSAAANTFAAPSDGTCPVLQPSTSYYVVLDRTSHSADSISLQLTTSDNEDDGGADGWTIDNTTKEYSSSLSSWQTTSNSRALMIEVKGSLVVPPDPTLLVKNTDQATYSPLDVTLRAQGFTTGTAPGGYNLTSIGVLFDQIGDVSEAPNVITATINEVNGTGPGTVFCTLGHPSAYAADSVNTYDASSCSTLSRNTPYFVVLNRTDMTAGGTISIRRTSKPKPR